MNNLKSLPLLTICILALILSLMSCGEDNVADETAYIVDVEIISPTNNTTMGIGETFTVEVDYARTENIIHNIKVEIVDVQGATVHNLVERHAHVANAFTFQSDPISIGQAGTYFVRASTTDLHTEGDEHHGTGGDEAGHDKDNLVEHTIIVQ